MLKDGVRAVIKKDSYQIPPIFGMLAKKGDIEEHMMYNTYNMGIGMVVAVDAADAERAMEAMKSAGDTPYIIGSIEAGRKGSNIMLRVVVMVSGGGTNLQAILDAVDNGKITNAEVVAVISNNEGVYAIERAKKHGVPAFVVTPKAYETRDAFDEALLETVKACKPDLIVLAGFLVKIPAAMIEAYRNKIINIHPSLIPSFCGVGYYGLKVHEAALARGVKVTGRDGSLCG